MAARPEVKDCSSSQGHRRRAGGGERQQRGAGIGGKARLGFGLEAGQHGEDEVPERRVLGDEEARRVRVRVLQKREAH